MPPAAVLLIGLHSSLGLCHWRNSWSWGCMGADFVISAVGVICAIISLPDVPKKKGLWISERAKPR